MNIIDKPEDLLKLKAYEVDEILLNDKYNKANLRELVRSCLRLTHAYKIQMDAVMQNEMHYTRIVDKIKNMVQ